METPLRILKNPFHGVSQKLILSENKTHFFPTRRIIGTFRGVAKEPLIVLWKLAQLRKNAPYSIVLEPALIY